MEAKVIAEREKGWEKFMTSDYVMEIGSKRDGKIKVIQTVESLIFRFRE